MTETLKTLQQLLDSFPTNDQGQITASDLRNFVASIYDEEEAPHGGLYWTTTTATTIATAGTYVKAAGTTDYSSAHRFNVDDDVGTNNRLRYTGSRPLHFHCVAQATINVPANNRAGGVQAYHFDASAGTGSLLAHSAARSKTNSNGDIMQLTSHCDVMLDTNDYLELWVTNEGGTEDVTVENGYVFMMGMIGQRGWRG